MLTAWAALIVRSTVTRMRDNSAYAVTGSKASVTGFSTRDDSLRGTRYPVGAAAANAGGCWEVVVLGLGDS